MEMDHKIPVQQPALEDVEDQDTGSLSSLDKQVMAQMGKRQQLKVRGT
jgi:choline transport protein